LAINKLIAFPIERKAFRCYTRLNGAATQGQHHCTKEEQRGTRHHPVGSPVAVFGNFPRAPSLAKVEIIYSQIFHITHFYTISL
jgi:hypothetical protein